MNKKVLTALAVCGVAAASFAADAGFDPSTSLSNAQSTVTTIVESVGGILAAAVALYVGFVGYRKLREGLNKC